MRPSARPILVLTTTATAREARKLARVLLAKRAVACATLVSRVESQYWWKGKIVRSGESLLLLKTLARALGPLKKLLSRHHSYRVPELLAVRVDDGLRPYLAWLTESLARRRS